MRKDVVEYFKTLNKRDRQMITDGVMEAMMLLEDKRKWRASYLVKELMHEMLAYNLFGKEPSTYV